MCDIVTYNNIYLIFIPSLGTELLKSLKFPNQVIKGVFRYANEVKFGKSMGPIRMGAGCQGKKASNQRVETFSLLPGAPPTCPSVPPPNQYTHL